MGTLEWHADRMSSDTDHHRTGVVRSRYLPMCVCVCVLRQQYTLGQMKCRAALFVLYYYYIINIIITFETDKRMLSYTSLLLLYSQPGYTWHLYTSYASVYFCV